jgi:hypothetical protein
MNPRTAEGCWFLFSEGTSERFHCLIEITHVNIVAVRMATISKMKTVRTLSPILFNNLMRVLNENNLTTQGKKFKTQKIAVLAILCGRVDKVRTANPAISRSMLGVIDRVRMELIKARPPPTIPDLSAWIMEDGTLGIPKVVLAPLKQFSLFGWDEYEPP